jgi:hypothetical protein
MPDATLAAVILYLRKHTPQHFAEKDFRKQLMLQLVDGYSARKASSVAAKRQRDSLHPLVRAAGEGACQLCRSPQSRGKHSRRNRWKCEDCNIYLCMLICYNKHIESLAIHREEQDSS